MDKKEVSVLVVEDNSSDIRVLHENIREFKTMSCRTTHASNMKDVEKMLDMEDFDAIFLDLNLPDSSGLDTVKRVNGKRKGAPVIIMTGTAEQELIIKALDLGVQNFIIKGEETAASLERAIMYSIEREKSMEELKKSRKIQEEIIKNSPIIIFVLDENRKAIIVNPETENFCGKSAAEILGRPSGEIFGCVNSLENEKGCGHGVRCKDCPLAAAIADVLTTGDNIRRKEIKYEILRENRKLERSLLVSAVRIPLNENFGILVSVEDVTEIRANEEKYKAIFNNAEVGIYRADAGSGKFIEFNEKMSRIFETEPGKMKDMSTTAGWKHPDRRDAMMRELAEKGEVNNYEIEALTTKGNTRFIIGSLKLDRERGFVEGTAVDITEFRETQRKLAESEQKWAVFTDSVDENMMLWDSDLNLVAANSMAVKVYVEMTGSELEPGKNILELMKNLKNTGRYEKYREVQRTGNPFLLEEYPVRNMGGETRYYSLKAFKVGSGMGLITTDITNVKRSETILRQSFEKLREVDRMKSNFISIVSHELRTPLTIIKGFTSFLKKSVAGPLNDMQKDYVNTIDLNTARLARIVNDMMDISKIESGNFPIEKERRELVGVINESVDGMHHIAHEKGISLETIIENKSAPAEIDRGRIIQAVSNLINNAMRFSKSGSTVKVGLKNAVDADIPLWAAEKMSEEKNYYYIYVADTGEGIEKKHLEKIFERFYQVENPNVRKHQGAGLGLSIAKIVAEAHDGFIWAESGGMGKGAKICMVIPE